jgi:hypothetical protein
MRWAVRTLVRLYPKAWMARYGEEYRLLLDDLPATPSLVLDVARRGIALHASRTPRRALQLVSRGGSLMHSQPERLAILGAAVLLPTAVLIIFAVTKYVFGFAGPFDAIEPTMTPIVTHPIGETLFIVAPYLAFALATIPVLRGGIRWQEGRLHAILDVRAPVPNILVAMASAAVALFMALYWIAENL